MTPNERTKRLTFLTSAFLVAALLLYLAFAPAVGSHVEHWAQALSGYAAGFVSILVVLTAALAVDHYALPGFDLLQELKMGNVAVAIAFAALLIAFALVMPQGARGQTLTDPAHLDTAEAYVGTVEPHGENRGPRIVRQSLASVGFEPGVSYCAAFVSYCLDAAEVDGPDVRSALATDFLSAPHTTDATTVRRGFKVPEPGTIIVFRKGQTIYGHIGFVTERWTGACGRTVEANTSAPDTEGSQRDGQGIWRRSRCIVPTDYFRPVGFVEVTPS